MNQSILKHLYCPNTHSPLAQHGHDYLYAKENLYPIINGVPWIFKNPEYSLLEWSSKIGHYFQEEESYIKYLKLKKNLDNVSSDLSLERINKIREAKEYNLHFFKDILSCFQTTETIPIGNDPQQIHSYFQLIFRDWSWEKPNEVEIYIEYCKNHIPKGAKNILILGCGASALNYHLATEYRHINFYGLDHNPFLIFCAKKIFSGEEIDLYDYVNFPKDLQSTNCLYKIKSPLFSRSNHQFLLGSFPDLPFKEESLDCIIAPWFFDILDLHLKDAIGMATNYLSSEGKLIFYGPNNIHKNNLDEQLSSDEILEITSDFFHETEFQKETIDYLNNPLSSQNRKEDVLFVTGSYPKNTDKYQLPAAQELRLNYSPEFEKYKAINQTYFHILKHINHSLDADDIAVIIHQEFGFSPEESLAFADSFIAEINRELK